MFTLALIISSFYMFICSASLSEDFSLTEDREGAQIITFAISVLLYMLSQVSESTYIGNYMFMENGFDLVSCIAVIALSYLMLDIIEKSLNQNDLYHSRNLRMLNSIPRQEFF